MKIFPVGFYLITAILLLGSFTPRMRADDEPKPASATDKVKQPVKLINVDFPGGSVTQLVAAIAKSDGAPFNVIGEKEDMQTQLPPFSIRNVEAHALGQTLSALLQQRGLNFGLSGPGIFVLVKDRNFAMAQGFDPTRSVFESFQLAPYLAEQSVDDIVAAIRSAWELDPTHDRNALRIKFHPPTSVLLVSGPRDGITLTKNVLGQIKRTPEMTPVPKLKNPPVPETERK